jgi:hypothetical protein
MNTPIRAIGPRRLARTLPVAVAALLAAALLGACNPDQLGAAAIIDGKVVSTDELQDDTRAYLAVVPDGDKSETQQRILERLILSRVIKVAARQAGVRVSAGTVADQRDQILASTGGRKGLVPHRPVGARPAALSQDRHQAGRRRGSRVAGGGDPGQQRPDRGRQADGDRHQPALRHVEP